MEDCSPAQPVRSHQLLDSTDFREIHSKEAAASRKRGTLHHHHHHHHHLSQTSAGRPDVCPVPVQGDCCIGCCDTVSSSVCVRLPDVVCENICAPDKDPSDLSTTLCLYIMTVNALSDIFYFLAFHCETARTREAKQ